MKWLDRYVERLFAKPAPFDCAWCDRDGPHGRHDMCTGSAVRPHREGMRPAAVTECACALRQHKRAARSNAPEATRLPTVPDPWTVPERRPEDVEGRTDGRPDPYRHVPLRPTATPEERRHKRARRHRVTAVRSVLPAVAVLLVLALASQYDGGGSGPPRPGAPGGPAAEPAVWAADPDRPPQRDTRSFTALVSRLGCGEVGDVLAPQVVENPSSVTVIFSVAPVARGRSGACTTSAAVPYSVGLATPLGDRRLFDGTCDLPPASSAPACVTAQRWPLERQAPP